MRRVGLGIDVGTFHAAAGTDWNRPLGRRYNLPLRSSPCGMDGQRQGDTHAGFWCLNAQAILKKARSSASNVAWPHGCGEHSRRRSEDPVKSIHRLVLPSALLIWMHLVLGGRDLLDCLVAPERFQRHFSLKLGHELPSFRHFEFLR